MKRSRKHRESGMPAAYLLAGGLHRVMFEPQPLMCMGCLRYHGAAEVCDCDARDLEAALSDRRKRQAEAARRLSAWIAGQLLIAEVMP